MGEKSEIISIEGEDLNVPYYLSYDFSEKRTWAKKIFHQRRAAVFAILLLLLLVLRVCGASERSSVTLSIKNIYFLSKKKYVQTL